MAPLLTGVVQGTVSAATYAATEKIAYGRNPSLRETLKVGITSGVLAGGTQFIGQKLGWIQCFIAGTLVATKNGLVPIEDIEPGDLVWATDEETGETALKEVVQLFRNETEEWVRITVDGEKITCTPNHPFYSPVKGWTSAIDLRAGDILVMLNGEYVVIEQVQHELLETSETTYNFEVKGFHTYYVGEEPVLVHNRGCGKSNFPTEGQPNSTQIRYGENGKVYSAATYGSDGKITARMDFQGKPHYVKSVGQKALPHVHPYANNNGFLRELPAITLDEFLRSLGGVKE